MTGPRCIQWVAVPGPRYTSTRPCSRIGTHRTPGGQYVCAQHARLYDLPPELVTVECHRCATTRDVPVPTNPGTEYRCPTCDARMGARLEENQ